MENNQKNNPNKKQVKDSNKATEKKTIFLYLQEHIATASMVSKATGVKQKNITRYKRDLEKTGKLWEVKKGYCKETGFKAWYLSTNPALSPYKNQLGLFD